MDTDKEANKIFIFGLCILIAWMFIIIICASPKVCSNYSLVYFILFVIYTLFKNVDEIGIVYLPVNHHFDLFTRPNTLFNKQYIYLK
ncbi:unnamed protein product [Brugia timori]|uniref:Uncharacterized protein n=1 Tax=Brugia timori TaxID=42155 RepID=A0A0R3QZH8_9BILA|nr:unnamed protein product [Brugia timori]